MCATSATYTALPANTTPDAVVAPRVRALRALQASTSNTRAGIAAQTVLLVAIMPEVPQRSARTAPPANIALPLELRHVSRATNDAQQARTTPVAVVPPKAGACRAHVASSRLAPALDLALRAQVGNSKLLSARPVAARALLVSSRTAAQVSRAKIASTFAPQASTTLLVVARPAVRVSIVLRASSSHRAQA